MLQQLKVLLQQQQHQQEHQQQQQQQSGLEQTQEQSKLQSQKPLPISQHTRQQESNLPTSFYSNGFILPSSETQQTESNLITESVDSHENHAHSRKELQDPKSTSSSSSNKNPRLPKVQANAHFLNQVNSDYENVFVNKHPLVSSDDPIDSEDISESTNDKQQATAQTNDMLKKQRKTKKHATLESMMVGGISSRGKKHIEDDINSISSEQKENPMIIQDVLRDFKQTKTVIQTNGQRLWSIVRRDIYFPIKFHGKVENGLWKKRKQKFKGSQSQSLQSEDVFLFIHPHGAFKQAWDMFTGLAQLYFPILMPIRICFDLNNSGYYLIDLALEIVFLMDMLFNCITGINVGGELIRDRSVLFRQYLRDNFFWDVVMLIPYQFFVSGLGYIKIFRLSRYWDRFLFLLHKTIYFMFKGGSSHKFAVLLYYLFKVSTLILLCVHVLACLWIQAGMENDTGEDAQQPSKFHQDGWVTKYYEAHPDLSPFGQIQMDVYVTAYYYVTTTIATVGYGDISAHTVTECMFTMFCEFFGIALFGYISGGLVSAVKMSLLVGTLKRSQNKTEFDNWLYQREKNKTEPFNRQLQKHLRAINGFNLMYNFSDFFRETEYFHYMPKEQKRRIFNILFTDVASFFGSFFRNITELSMIQEIFGFMHPLTFLPGGEIIQFSSLSRGIYFIVSGKVYVCNRKEEQSTNNILETTRRAEQNKQTKTAKDQLKQNFRKLKAGSFFGEFCLLEKNSTLSFIAGGPEPLLTLFITKSKFVDICTKYKETYSWLKKFAYYRFKYFNMEKSEYIRKKTINMKNQSNISPIAIGGGATGMYSDLNKLKEEKTIWENAEVEESDGNSVIDIDNVINLEKSVTKQPAKKIDAAEATDSVQLQPISSDEIIEIDESDMENISLFPMNSGRNALEEIPLPQAPISSPPQNKFHSVVPASFAAHSGTQISTPMHRSNKSDLEFFMEKGPDFYFAESMKHHARFKSCSDISTNQHQNGLLSRKRTNQLSHDFEFGKIGSSLPKIPNSFSVQRSTPGAATHLKTVSTGSHDKNDSFHLQQTVAASGMPLKAPRSQFQNAMPLQSHRKVESSDYQQLHMEEFQVKPAVVLPQMHSHIDNNPLIQSYLQDIVEEKVEGSPIQGQLMSPHYLLFSPTQLSSHQLQSNNNFGVRASDSNKDEDNTEIVSNDMDNPATASQARQLLYPNSMLPRQHTLNSAAQTHSDAQFFPSLRSLGILGLDEKQSMIMSLVDKKDVCSISKSGSSDYLDSDEEEKMRNFLSRSQTVKLQKRQSLSSIQNIRRAEKKIRNAFRLLTHSNPSEEIVLEMNQLKLVQEAGIGSIPHSDQSKLSSLHMKKHKVMKKMLQKKIDLLVSQTAERPSIPNLLTYESSSMGSNRSSQFQTKKNHAFTHIKSSTNLAPKPKIPSNTQINSDKIELIATSLSSQSSAVGMHGLSAKSIPARSESCDDGSRYENGDVSQNNDSYDISNDLQINEFEDSIKEDETVVVKRRKEVGLSEFGNTNNNAVKPENISEVSEEEEDSIEIQMDAIKRSRFPNFELMLYIEKLISQNEEEYQQDLAINGTDDYQCYEEIENDEQVQARQNYQEQANATDADALDLSIDIPIDILKPNFENDELEAIPSFLENQIIGLDMKLNQMVNSVYDDCLNCIEKIQGLNQGKSKGLRSNNAESRQYTTSINDIASKKEMTIDGAQSTIPAPSTSSRSLLKTMGFAQKIVQNNLMSKTLIQSGGEQARDGSDSPAGFPVRLESIGGRVNLGLNIEFSINQMKESGDGEESEKSEYNFFTELDRKNQLNREKAQIYSAVVAAASAGAIGSQQACEGKDRKINVNGGESKIESKFGQMEKSIIKASILNSASRIEQEIQSVQALRVSQGISEQTKIKMQFKRAFLQLQESSTDPTGVKELSDSMSILSD